MVTALVEVVAGGAVVVPLVISPSNAVVAVVAIVVVVFVATVLVEVLVVVVAVPKCTIIQVSAHGCGGKTCVWGIGC